MMRNKLFWKVHKRFTPNFKIASKMSNRTNDFSHRLSLADDFYRFIFGNYILIRMELKALKKALNTC